MNMQSHQKPFGHRYDLRICVEPKDQSEIAKTVALTRLFSRATKHKRALQPAVIPTSETHVSKFLSNHRIHVTIAD